MLPFFFMSRRGGEQCRKCSDNPGIKPLCTCRTDNEKARNDKTLQAFSLLAAAAGLDLFDAIVDLNHQLVICSAP